MIKRLILLLFILLSIHNLIAKEIRGYFAPNGGFSKKNLAKRIELPDKTQLTPTLTNSVFDLIERTPKNGMIKIAMYSFSEAPMQDRLIKAAQDKNLTLKITIDNIASWSASAIDKFMDKIDAAMKIKKFDIHVKLIKKKDMINLKRTRVLNSGKTIYGSMHEKFGLFYMNKNDKHATHCFNGSSNLSTNSSSKYAENRIVFKDSPAICNMFEAEFARIWNTMGDKRFGSCPDEKFEKINKKAKMDLIFNYSKKADGTYNRIDLAIMDALDKVNKKNGTIDIAMFSFTHWDLTQKIIKIAIDNPKVKIRFLLDHNMLEASPGQLGLMSLVLEKTIKEKNIKNITIRYRFGGNAYGLDKKKNIIDIVHKKSKLFHHKFIIIDKKILVTGSYNWSESAEKRNLENLMIFNKKYKEHKEIVNGFINEYRYVWNSKKLTTTGKKGRIRSAKIRDYFAKTKKARSIRNYIAWEKRVSILQIVRHYKGYIFKPLEILLKLHKLGLIKFDKKTPYMIELTY